MPQITSRITGQALNAFMGSGGSNNQSLVITIPPSNGKRLYQVTASAQATASPLATATQSVARLIICTGQFADADVTTVIQVSPFFAQLVVPNLGRLLYDVIFRDKVELNFFDKPLVVPQGETLTICLGTPFNTADTTLTASQTVGTLSANIEEFGPEDWELPRLR